MTTCLINDQINNKRKMSILSVETLLESGKLFKKNFQSRSSDTCAASSTQCPNFRGLCTSKVTWYYMWNLKPKRWIDQFPIETLSLKGCVILLTVVKSLLTGATLYEFSRHLEYYLWYTLADSSIGFWNRLNPTFTMAGRLFQHSTSTIDTMTSLNIYEWGKL